MKSMLMLAMLGLVLLVLVCQSAVDAEDNSYQNYEIRRALMRKFGTSSKRAGKQAKVYALGDNCNNYCWQDCGDKWHCDQDICDCVPGALVL